ncbi:hypothetical protein M5E87_02515 [Flavonifractor plautii]|nr:hypothetical protein M5E87_02515 [Flavonifractor plautii]
MHIGTRLGAAGLAAALLLPTGALAAGPDQTQARQEDLDTLYAALQEHHPDLYANTPRRHLRRKRRRLRAVWRRRATWTLPWISRVWWPSSATPTPPPISAPF